MARGATGFVRRGFLVRLGPLRLLLPLVALRSALAEAAALGGALPDRPSPACRPGQAALPPLIGRKDRRQLTRALNTTTHVAPWPDLAAPLPICWQPRRAHWVPRRPRQARRRRLRRRCGFAVLRVGEATNPGPPQPGTPVGGERPRRMDLDSPRERSPARNAPPRVFCPVPSCPCSQALTARGWSSHASMRHHLDDHASGSLQGTLPAAYLAAHNLDLCSVCGLTVAHRSNGTHPRCRPQQRQHARNSHPSERSGARLAGPSLAEIFAAPGPVLRHVPKAARSGWAQCLARSLAAVADQNSLSAWVQLCMLPKAVLRPAPRGGVSRRNQAASFTQRRCARWLEGERHELWEPERSSRQRRRPHPTDSEDEDDTLLAARHARCLALAAEGELSRACASLVDPPLLEKNAAVIAALRHKHPTAPPARPSLLASGPCPVGAVPDFAVADVVKAARSFRRGSAAGPSGLRGEHLREALESAHGDEVAAHLTRVVQLLVRGEAPFELAQHLAGATLHALPKGQDDVRPIAVGETLRRLVAKCLCSHVKSEAREWLSPLQVGVAVPLGAEAAVHSSRHWVHAYRNNPDKVFLKLDFVNAFNTVHRATVLREVRLRLPAMAPWAEWCYSHHTKLLFQGEALTSEAGVQQGDPLGPLLFALALQPSLCAAGRSQLDLCFAYLDDVCLAGDYTAVSAALGRLVNAARQVGLHLNVGKCELTTLGGPNTNLDSSLFPPWLAHQPFRGVRSAWLCPRQPQLLPPAHQAACDANGTSPSSSGPAARQPDSPHAAPSLRLLVKACILQPGHPTPVPSGCIEVVRPGSSSMLGILLHGSTCAGGMPPGHLVHQVWRPWPSQHFPSQWSCLYGFCSGHFSDLLLAAANLQPQHGCHHCQPQRVAARCRPCCSPTAAFPSTTRFVSGSG